jgi:hypothetical protein
LVVQRHQEGLLLLRLIVLLIELFLEEGETGLITLIQEDSFGFLGQLASIEAVCGLSSVSTEEVCSLESLLIVALLEWKRHEGLGHVVLGDFTLLGVSLAEVKHFSMHALLLQNVQDQLTGLWINLDVA